LPRESVSQILSGGDAFCRSEAEFSRLLAANILCRASRFGMIRKLKSGEFRLYSRKKDESTGKRKNLGTFESLEKAKQHEREVQYFKRH
jgi:hypothetical protein